MSREIKFRDYEPIEKCMRFFDLDTYDREEHDCYGNIMQFTGLKDKNGVDVYEGDFLKLNEYAGDIYKEVIFHNGCFCIHGFNWERKSVEVIGNIHENPKLL